MAVAGKLNLPENACDYARIALIVGLTALFSSLYLDAALSRFDSLKDSVIAGKYESKDQGKSQVSAYGLWRPPSVDLCLRDSAAAIHASAHSTWHQDGAHCG